MQHTYNKYDIKKLQERISELKKQKTDLLVACKDLVKANQYARAISLRNETPRGSIWSDARSMLDATKLKAERIIAKAEEE